MADVFDQLAPDTPKSGGDVFDQIQPDKIDLRSQIKSQYGDTAVIKRSPNALPAVGGFLGGIPGAAAGAFAKQAIAPNPSIGDALEDTATQGVLPKVLEGLGNFIKGGKSSAAAMIAKLPDSIVQKLPGVQKAQITNQLVNQMKSQSSLIESAAAQSRKNASSLSTQTQVPSSTGLIDATGNPTTITQTTENPVYSTPIGKKLTGVESSAPAFNKVIPAAKELLSDIQSVRNAKMMTGDPDTIRKIAASDLVTRNFRPSTNTFNASGIVDELGGPKADIYKEALGKQGYSTLKELADLGVKKGVGLPEDSLISWHEARKIGLSSMGAQLLGVPYHVTAPIILGADALNKIASNPELGQLVIHAMKTSSSLPQSGLLMKAALVGLRGVSVSLTDSDGQKHEGTIQLDQKGNPQIQPLQSPVK